MPNLVRRLGPMVLLAALFAGGCAPSDKELILHLKQKWPQFDLMTTIIAQEKDFRGLDCEKDNPGGMMKTLKKLCLELDLKAISVGGSGINFLASSPGMFSGDSYRGYVFTHTPLPPVAEDGEGTIRYHQVGAGWFIFEAS